MGVGVWGCVHVIPRHIMHGMQSCLAMIIFKVTLKLNVGHVTVKTLRDSVLKEQFGMVAPDVEIEDGKGTRNCGFYCCAYFAISCFTLHLSQAPYSCLVRKEKPKVRIWTRPSCGGAGLVCRVE